MMEHLEVLVNGLMLIRMTHLLNNIIIEYPMTHFMKSLKHGLQTNDGMERVFS
jgi:hypothetical protein